MATTATERKLLIGGEWVETGDWLEVRSPYSGDLVGRVAKAGAAETQRAIDAAERGDARAAAGAQARRDPRPRRAGSSAAAHDEVAQTISDEAGKPMKAARVEAKRAMSTFTMAAVEARKLAGEMVPMDASQAGSGKLAFTLRVPLGVVGAISPFNFPLNLVAHKIAPALAAGCAVVLKPASQTPLSALLLAELETEAGLPPGWLNVVVGPAVRDRRRARRGRARAADHVHRLGRGRLEARGARAAQARQARARQRDAGDRRARTPTSTTPPRKLAANAFSFAGQSCISVQRIYVQRAAYDELLARFVPKVEALVVGDPADEETDVGPVIDDDARERILAWIEEARAAGARDPHRRRRSTAS